MHIHRHGEEDATGHAGPGRAVHESHTGSRVSQQGPWSAGFVVTREWGAFLQFLCEIVIGSLNMLLCWQGGRPYREQLGELVKWGAYPFDKGHIWREQGNSTIRPLGFKGVRAALENIGLII